MSSMFWVSPEGGLQNLSEQPVSVLCHSYSKECFPHIQVDLPVFQFVPIALPTIIKFHWQSVFKIFVYFYEVPSQLPLLQANKPSSLRLSSQEKCPSLIIFVPLVFLNYQAQNWTHHLSSLNMVILPLILSRYDCLSQVYTDTAGLCPIVYPQTGWRLHSQNPSLWSCSQSVYPPACHDTGDCPNLGAALCTWPCWTSWGSLELIPQASQVPLDATPSL